MTIEQGIKHIVYDEVIEKYRQNKNGFLFESEEFNGETLAWERHEQISK